METLTKEKKKETLGRKSILSDDIGIYAKVNYTKGIETFDRLLGNKSQDDFKAKIHLIKQPKGIEIKLAKLFKSYSHAVSYNNIAAITFKNPNQPVLSIKCLDNNEIEFIFSIDDFLDILTHFRKNYKLKIDFGIDNKEYDAFKKKFNFIEESKDDFFAGRITGGRLFLLYISVGIFALIVRFISGDVGLGIAISTIAFFFLLLPAYVKRLHDINKSGIYTLYLLIPFFNIGYLIYLFVVEGTNGDNKYGTDPRKEK